MSTDKKGNFEKYQIKKWNELKPKKLMKKIFLHFMNAGLFDKEEEVSIQVSANMFMYLASSKHYIYSYFGFGKYRVKVEVNSSLFGDEYEIIDNKG